MKQVAKVFSIVVVSFLFSACEGGGSSCLPGSGCPEGEYCTLDMTTEDMLAGRLVYHCKEKKKLGEPCTMASDRDVNPCEDGSFCGQAAPRAEYTCLESVAPNGACASTYGGPFVCQGGGMCVTGAGPDRTCQPDAGRAGSDCDSIEDCQAGLFCDQATSKCKERLAEGGTCNPGGYFCFGSGNVADRCTFFSVECAQGLYCRMPTATECGISLQCDNFDQCCVSASGTECRNTDPGPACEEPVGICGA